MTKQGVRVLGHDGSSEGITLVSTKIVVVSPTTTDKLLEVITSIEFLIIWREIVQYL